MSKVRAPTVTKGRLTVPARGLFMRAKVSKTVTRGSPLNELNQARLDDKLFEIIRIANNEPADQPRMQPTRRVNQTSPLSSVHQDTYSPLLDDPPTPRVYADPSKRRRCAMQGPGATSVANASDNERFSPRATSTARKPQPRSKAERARESRRKAGQRQQLGASSASTSGGYETAGSAEVDFSPPQPPVVHPRKQANEPALGSYEHFAAEMTDQLTEQFGNLEKKTDFFTEAKLKLQGFYKKIFKKANTTDTPSLTELKSNVGVESASGGCRLPLLPVPCSSALKGALTGVSCSSLYKTTTPHSATPAVPSAIPLHASQPQHSMAKPKKQTRPPLTSVNRHHYLRAARAGSGATVALPHSPRSPEPGNQQHYLRAARAGSGVSVALPHSPRVSVDLNRQHYLRAARSGSGAAVALPHSPRSPVPGNQQHYLRAARTGSGARVALPHSPQSPVPGNQQHYLRATRTGSGAAVALPHSPRVPVDLNRQHYLRAARTGSGAAVALPHSHQSFANVKWSFPTPPRQQHRSDQTSDDSCEDEETFAFSPYIPPPPVFDDPMQYLRETLDKNAGRHGEVAAWGGAGDAYRRGGTAVTSRYGVRATLTSQNPEVAKRLRSSSRAERSQGSQPLPGDRGVDCGEGRSQEGRSQEGRSQEMRNIDEWCKRQEQESSYYLQTIHDSPLHFPRPVLEDSGIDVTSAPVALNPWESATPERKFYRRRLC